MSIRNNSYDVIVVGAGASGLMAALVAARVGARVLLIEHLEKVGKKILSTGNGKCNYTNDKQGTSYYRGNDPAFVVPIFQQFSMEDTVSYFEELGIYPKVKNGYYYPYSEQATAVVEVLELALRNARVTIQCQCELIQVKTTKSGIRIQTSKGVFEGKNCIFATGLLAGRKCGCDGSAFQHLEKLGHTFIDVVPALVQMKSDNSFLKNLAGIRAEICLKMYINNTLIGQDRGELLHIDGGISGIVTFQLSRYAARAIYQNNKEHLSLIGKKRQDKVSVSIDYCPDLSYEDLCELLKMRFGKFGEGKDALEAMIGFTNYKLALAFLDETDIDAHKPANKVTDKEIQRLAKCMKDLVLDITGTKGYEDAQVCAGGLDTSQFDNVTLESKLVPGIYACGELLDIDGMCGGYNLQWAWSSGYVAGIHAARKCERG